MRSMRSMEMLMSTWSRLHGPVNRTNASPTQDTNGKKKKSTGWWYSGSIPHLEEPWLSQIVADRGSWSVPLGPWGSEPYLRSSSHPLQAATE